jgi:ubiquinone/menaquinone biosynthesis C-methylase UbiE
MELDWGDGDYERTAEVLAPAAEAVIDAAGVGTGDWVLDVACGTGNAALVAAARGASVVGVDLSPALIDLARARARAAQAPDVTFLVGDAGNLPVEAGAFDAAVSVFGVIFAPDPALAVGQMLAALRPGGSLLIASWLSRGPIHEAGRALREALPDVGGPERIRWDDPEWVRDLLGAAGAREVRQDDGVLTFSAPSAEEWFAEQEEHHPVWRWARPQLDPERWEAVRARSVELLRAGSDEAGRFHGRSPYLVTRATR